jgi:glycosyltransferase involved in cell wall biosynthesis
MNVQPLVSVVTSTYNRAEILRRPIESVLAQTYTNWEMCVVGDCTPDHSEQVVLSYGDPRIRYHNLSVKSPPGSHGAIAKNYALQQMCTGRYVAYLDDDDSYTSRFLEVMMKYLVAHPDAAIAYCRSCYRHKKSGRKVWGNPMRRFTQGYSREKLLRYNYINTNEVIHKREILDEVGYWDPDYYYDDYELWLRISAKYDFHFINKPLVNYFIEIDPFFIRIFTKGWHILRHGRKMTVK